MVGMETTTNTDLPARRRPYPGFGRQSGQWFSSASMVVLAVLLYGVFKYKDWL